MSIVYHSDNDTWSNITWSTDHVKAKNDVYNYCNVTYELTLIEASINGQTTSDVKKQIDLFKDSQPSNITIDGIF